MEDGYEYKTVSVPRAGAFRKRDRARNRVLEKWTAQGWELQSYQTRMYTPWGKDVVVFRRKTNAPTSEAPPQRKAKGPGILARIQDSTDRMQAWSDKMDARTAELKRRRNE